MNLIDFDFYRRITELGVPERSLWKFSWGGRTRFDPVWDMVLEGSTGFSGSFARQVTLNRASVAVDSKQRQITGDLLDALERSAREGGIVLQGEGAFIEEAKSLPVTLQFDAQYRGGTYVKRDGDRAFFARSQLVSLAADGRFVGTFTARLGAKVDVDHPQPALWTVGPIEKQRGKQEFPILQGGNISMTMSGRHIRDDALLIVDGRRVSGSLSCNDDTVKVTLTTLPSNGMHLLQIQNPDGLFSNDFIFHVAEDLPNVDGAPKK